MLSLKEIIHVDRPVGECFDYVADFRSAAEWDATAYKAVKLSDGPVGVGTTFDVWCRLPIGSVKIRYTVAEFEPGELLTLHADCWLFEATDSIAFREENGCTTVEYRADFSFRMPFSALESALQSGMERMGKASLAGLQKALEDDFNAPKASSGTARADRLVWPGLALFSKLGYRRGRKRWNPVSANLRGKRIVITGASSGLGYAAAKSLAERGADLVLVMRNPEKAAAVVADLKEATGNDAIREELADLSLMRDVDALIERLIGENRPIDVLINNAGALFNPRQVTDEGLENSFALLLLSPYRLTLGLQPLLAAAEGARVVNVISGGMYSQKLEVKKLQAREQNYSGSVAYARCKRALTVLTEEWAKQWEQDDIVVNAMHPGWADTPGVETALPAFHRLARMILRTPEEGADTIIWLAAASEADKVSGKLFLDREPRTTHLMAKTREGDEERQRLLEFLQHFELEESAAA